MKKNVTINIAVSVKEDWDFTRISVRTRAASTTLRLEAFDVAFETDSIKDLGPIEWTPELQLRDDTLKDRGYKFLNSRDQTVKLLSDYLKLKIFDTVDSLKQGDVLDDCIVTYQLLIDNSLGLDRFSDSLKLIVDALYVDSHRAWMIDMLGSPVILNGIKYEKALNDPIRHTSTMFQHYFFQ